MIASYIFIVLGYLSFISFSSSYKTGAEIPGPRDIVE